MAHDKVTQLRVLIVPVYKLTFYSLKISPKNCPPLTHGSKTEIKKIQDKFLECNHSVPERKFYDKRYVFQENSYPEIRKTYYLASKWGVDLYTGLTY